MVYAEKRRAFHRSTQVRIWKVRLLLSYQGPCLSYQWFKRSTCRFFATSRHLGKSFIVDCDRKEHQDMEVPFVAGEQRSFCP